MKNKKLDNITLVTGGFDPIHSGHISYLNAAKQLGNFLVVGINSNEWLIRKKNNFFMTWEERSEILKNIVCVDMVIDFNDLDDSACNAIEKCLLLGKKVTFVNGGDRLESEIPELKAYSTNPNVDFIFGVGGNSKMNSSSWILDEYVNKKIDTDIKFKNKLALYTKKAPWGSHTVIFHGDLYKVKKINVDQGKQLSLQFHNHRDEHWIIVQGSGLLTIKDETKNIKENEYIYIRKNQIHRIKNNGNQELILIEISTGNYLEDDDIVRLEDDFSRI